MVHGSVRIFGLNLHKKQTTENKTLPTYLHHIHHLLQVFQLLFPVFQPLVILCLQLWQHFLQVKMSYRDDLHQKEAQGNNNTYDAGHSLERWSVLLNEKECSLECWSHNQIQRREDNSWMCIQQRYYMCCVTIIIWAPASRCFKKPILQFNHENFGISLKLLLKSTSAMFL